MSRLDRVVGSRGRSWVASMTAIGFSLALLAQPLAVLADEGKGLTIRGVVLDDEKSPLKEIRILVLSKASGNVIARTQTGSDGQYRFEGLPAMEYDILADVNPTIYECGAYEAMLGDGDKGDDPSKRGVITMNWTLYRKGKCRQDPMGCLVAAVPAQAGGFLAAVPVWVVAAGSAGLVAVVGGATLGSLCLSGSWPCEEQNKPQATPTR